MKSLKGIRDPQLSKRIEFRAHRSKPVSAGGYGYHRPATSPQSPILSVVSPKSVTLT